MSGKKYVFLFTVEFTRSRQNNHITSMAAKTQIWCLKQSKGWAKTVRLQRIFSRPFPLHKKLKSFDQAEDASQCLLRWIFLQGPLAVGFFQWYNWEVALGACVAGFAAHVPNRSPVRAMHTNLETTAALPAKKMKLQDHPASSEEEDVSDLFFDKYFEKQRPLSVNSVTTARSHPPELSFHSTNKKAPAVNHPSDFQECVTIELRGCFSQTPAQTASLFHISGPRIRGFELLVLKTNLTPCWTASSPASEPTSSCNLAGWASPAAPKKAFCLFVTYLFVYQSHFFQGAARSSATFFQIFSQTFLVFCSNVVHHVCRRRPVQEATSIRATRTESAFYQLLQFLHLRNFFFFMWVTRFAETVAGSPHNQVSSPKTNRGSLTTSWATKEPDAFLRTVKCWGKRECCTA